jgi:hypothetical protein
MVKPPKFSLSVGEIKEIVHIIHDTGRHLGNGVQPLTFAAGFT